MKHISKMILWLCLTIVTTSLAEDSQVSRKVEVVIPLIKELPEHPAYSEIVQILGDPDADVGSGIFILVFGMDDGSKLFVGTSDKKNVQYIDYQEKEGGIMRRIKPKQDIK